MEIHHQTSPEAAAAEAGEYLNAFLTEHKSQPVLLLLSGGSALNLLNYVGAGAVGENLTISVLDERFSQDPAINNFAQIQRIQFYSDALAAGCGFFGTLPRNNESAEDLAARWQENILAWTKENPEGLIAATLGLGSDGHTAGIFPFPENPGEFKRLFESENFVAAYHAAGKNQFPGRITAALTLLKNLDAGFAYACGKEKRQALQSLLTGKKTAATLPAAAWLEIKQLDIFTDLDVKV